GMLVASAGCRWLSPEGLGGRPILEVSMSASKAVIGLAFLVAVLPALPARAIPIGDATCRRSLGNGVKNAMGVVLKAQQSCFKSVMAGKLTGVNCDDVHDPAFPGALKVQAAANKAVSLASSGCALAASPQTNGYVFCPSPCGAISISGYSDVANCLVCLTESESSIADNSAYGTPPPAPPVLNQKCQILVGKAFQKYSDTRAKVQQSCQFSEDISPLGTNCRISDPRGTVAKAVIKLKLSIAKCTDGQLAGLASCANNVNGEQSCIQGATDLMLDNLFADVYTPAGTSAVFVSSSTGHPGGAGTIADPVDTITGGLTKAIGSGAGQHFLYRGPPTAA